MSATDIWMLIAGLGLFLYGMFHLEDSMKQLEGRSFKLFLKKNTKNKFKAILSGTMVTAVLQSSSIVNLMVLSFVGAGILSMRNAIAVVLGANIGGTFNSWLVALLGFKVDINSITLPLIGIAGICLVVFKQKKTIYQIGLFCMGLGMLFLGLQFMKQSMDAMMTQFDFSPYLTYPRIVFLLIGFIITSIVQTSSATVVVVLTALNAHVIPIETAVAVVLGAELGTTVKLILGAIGGNAAKKRVALGNSLFNVLTSAAGFIFIEPIIQLITQFFLIKDPILVLVAFQTFINLAGVILIYFFLNKYGDFLEKQFKESKKTVLQFLQNASVEVPSTITDMMNKEVGLYIERVIRFNLTTFHIRPNWLINSEFEGVYQSQYAKNDTIELPDQYQQLKESEGEILAYYSKVISQIKQSDEIVRINKLIEALRNAMYSAKGMKDVYQDKTEFSNSINEVKYEMYHQFQAELSEFYKVLYRSFTNIEINNGLERITELLEKIKIDFDERINHFYFHAGQNILKEKEISTLFNLNRELYSSCKAIALAVKDFKDKSE
jgi:phosphate:Na+ symporter